MRCARSSSPPRSGSHEHKSSIRQILQTHLRPYPYFRRQGVDLELELAVTLAEAYLGATIAVPTPDGVVQMKLPPRSQQGARLRLQGKGVARGEQRGALYVELDVRMPDQPDEALEEGLSGGERLCSKNVRDGVSL